MVDPVTSRGDSRLLEEALPKSLVDFCCNPARYANVWNTKGLRRNEALPTSLDLHDVHKHESVEPQHDNPVKLD